MVVNMRQYITLCCAGLLFGSVCTEVRAGAKDAGSFNLRSVVEATGIPGGIIVHLDCGDGRETIRLFRERADDITLIILDMQMPFMNGEETLRKIRQIKRDTIVILTSGYTEADATKRFAGLGLAGFIQKPYRLC